MITQQNKRLVSVKVHPNIFKLKWWQDLFFAKDKIKKVFKAPRKNLYLCISLNKKVQK